MSKKPTRAAAPAKPAPVEIDAETGEVREVAVIPQDFGGELANYKVIKQVTVPVLTWPEGHSLTFEAVAPIYTGKVIEEKRGGDADKKPAELMHIRSPAGQLRQIVVGAVLKGELTENYPNDSYVGKWFFATKYEPNRARKQRYATYAVVEIADPR